MKFTSFLLASLLVTLTFVTPQAFAQCNTLSATSSKHMAPLELFSKRHFSARTFSSLAC